MSVRYFFGFLNVYLRKSDQNTRLVSLVSATQTSYIGCHEPLNVGCLYVHLITILYHGNAAYDPT